MVARCYPYRCNCGYEFDVYKPMTNIDDIETCKSCGADLDKSKRLIVGGMFYGTKVEDAEYCPALGQVVQNSKHRATIAKQRDLIEIGNEDPNKLQDRSEQDREEKRQKSYDDYFSTSIEVKG